MYRLYYYSHRPRISFYMLIEKDIAVPAKGDVISIECSQIGALPSILRNNYDRIEFIVDHRFIDYSSIAQPIWRINLSLLTVIKP